MALGVSFYRSLVGKKIVMAVTGVMLFIFIVEHMIGNLLIFVGPAQLNGFAAFLKSTHELLWVTRIILMLALLLHIVAATQITWANWKARPVSYVVRKDVETDYAARTMIYSGLLLVLYVIYHLQMFTLLTTGPGYSPTDVYGNVVAAFQAPAISVIYIAAMILLGMHLYHGIWSMLQTLGLEYGAAHRGRRRWAMGIAIAITAGYISIPIAVLTRLVS